MNRAGVQVPVSYKNAISYDIYYVCTYKTTKNHSTQIGSGEPRAQVPKTDKNQVGKNVIFWGWVSFKIVSKSVPVPGKNGYPICAYDYEIIRTIHTFLTGNQLESIDSWSLKDPMKVSMISLMLNMHTAEPLIALTGVLNTPYTTESLIPVRAVLNMSLVPSAEENATTES